MKRLDDPVLRDSFVDLLLEERFADRDAARPPADAEMPERGRRSGEGRRTSLALAAALLLGGVAIVVGVARTRGGGDPTRAPGSVQDPAEHPTAEHTMDARAFFPLDIGHRWTYREFAEGEHRALDRRIAVEVTAVVDVGGHRVAMLTEIDEGGGEIVFSYWFADERGVHRLAAKSSAADPTLDPAVGSESLELPSPIGAHAEWQFERFVRPDPVKGVRAALLRQAAPPPAQQVTGRLLGVGVERTCGPRTYRTVHVALDDEASELHEELHLARGTGIVRRMTRRPGKPDLVRELVAFAPAGPRPDRTHVLAGLIGDAAAQRATWLEKDHTTDAAWTQRSEFAIVPGEGDDPAQVYRVFGTEVVTFAPGDAEAYAAMAVDEDYAVRMRGLFAQRMTMGLVWLRWQLHAATTEDRVVPALGHGVEIGPGTTRGFAQVDVIAPDGRRTHVQVEVDTENGMPTRVSMR